MTDDEGAVSVGQDLAQRADLTDRLERARLDHGERLVEAYGLALTELFDLDVRRARQAHPATGGEHVDGVVVVGAEQHAVAAGGLAEPVDLLAEREQLLTRLLQG